jgi:pyruvate/2-oxoglutarate/acetoin dehydrogenase E1 component
VVVDSDIEKIINQYKKVKKVVLVDNPTSLFISEREFYKLISQNGSIRVRNSINIVAVTINPMTPYDKWFDEDVFIKRMQRSIDLPVFNVLKQPL